jgi:type I restriction enzyme S subunit
MEQQAYIRRNALQTGVPHTNLAHLRRTPLKLPRLEIQRTIAEILGALDDNIEANVRLTVTLDDTLVALFEQIAQQTVDTGETPIVGRLGDITRIVRTAVTPSDRPAEMFEHYSIPAFDRGQVPSKERGAAIMSGKLRVAPNAVLLSKLNPRIPRVWLPPPSPPPAAVCSTEFLVLVPKAGWSREFIYGLVKSTQFQRRLVSHATGTSSSHQRVRPDALLGLEVFAPPEPMLRRYDSVAGPITELLASTREQSGVLSATRDSLLVRLLSGATHVPAAGQAHDVNAVTSSGVTV